MVDPSPSHLADYSNRRDIAEVPGRITTLIKLMHTAVSKMLITDEEMMCRKPDQRTATIKGRLFTYFGFSLSLPTDTRTAVAAAQPRSRCPRRSCKPFAASTLKCGNVGVQLVSWQRRASRQGSRMCRTRRTPARSQPRSRA